MSKQLINLGPTVDSGQGDYLRKGGEKINEVFDDIYEKIGDGEILYPAGGWKNIIANNDTFDAILGQSYIIDTSNGTLTINLPKGDPTLIGKGIKLRDGKGTWDVSNVYLSAALGDTIKGNSSVFSLDKKLQDIELVYCAPATWQYVDNKTLNAIDVNGANAPRRQSYICTEGQIDFPIAFTGIAEYNTENLQVYHRGNLLYYGATFSEDSDYGSIPSDPSDTSLVPLDGTSIRLHFAPKAGDPVEFVTFLDSVTTFKSSYISRTIQVLDEKYTLEKSTRNGLWVGDLENKHIFTLAEFGFLSADGQININSVEMLRNGHQLTKSGTAGSPSFICEGAEGDDRITCENNGGIWEESGVDFSIIKNDFEEYKNIKIAETLEHGDILTIKWFNNDIGSLLSKDEIEQIVSDKFLNSEYRTTIKGRIRYSDIDNPSANTTELNPVISTNMRFENIQQFFDQIYPIGTIYKNANNPNNPADYMGFGVWKRYAEGRAIVSWNSKNPNDLDFGINNNADNRHVAGGTVGEKYFAINSDNIPLINTNEKVLIEDKDRGDISLGQCEPDPSAELPNAPKFLLTEASVGKNPSNEISNIQPSITAHVWIRVA